MSRILVAVVLAGTFLAPVPTDVSYRQRPTKVQRATTYKLRGHKLPRRLLMKFDRDQLLRASRRLTAEFDAAAPERLLKPRPMRQTPDGPVVKKAKRRRAPRCPADAEAVYVGSSLQQVEKIVERPPAVTRARRPSPRVGVVRVRSLPRPRDALASSAASSTGLA